MQKGERETKTYHWIETMALSRDNTTRWDHYRVFFDQYTNATPLYYDCIEQNFSW